MVRYRPRTCPRSQTDDTGRAIFDRVNAGDLGSLLTIYAQVNRDEVNVQKLQRRLGGDERRAAGRFVWPVSYLATANGGAPVTIQVGDRFVGIASAFDAAGLPSAWEAIDYEVVDVAPWGSLPAPGRTVGAALFLSAYLIYTPEGNLSR